ncbi:MAG: DinB family protein [Chitinophagaceae bacterium]
MLKNFFSELFEYNHSVNKLLIQTLVEQQHKASEKSFHLLNHIINAHETWNRRLLSNSSFDNSSNHPVDELINLETINNDNSILALSKLDLFEPIEYKTGSGKLCKDPVKDILFQIINHSNYHRAQIATECRLSGIEPLVTDYIFYKWNRTTEAL